MHYGRDSDSLFGLGKLKKNYGKVRKSKGKLGKHGKERTVITNARKASGLDRKNWRFKSGSSKYFVSQVVDRVSSQPSRLSFME